MTTPIWKSLLTQGLGLLDRTEQALGAPLDWSFGGGTVLMLRMNHRQSKDIDIFLTDPQVLGFFNPRVNEGAQSMSLDYEESAGHIKLYLPEGEIDFVVAQPLTEDPFEQALLLDHQISLERSGEIIAKKMWHRGNLATARDLFDLAAVQQADPAAIEAARPFLSRHAESFLHQVEVRQRVMRAEFDAIDRQECVLTFDEASVIAESILRPLISHTIEDSTS